MLLHCCHIEGMMIKSAACGSYSRLNFCWELPTMENLILGHI